VKSEQRNSERVGAALE